MIFLLKSILSLPVFGVVLVSLFFSKERYCWVFGVFIAYLVLFLTILLWLFFDYSTPYFQGCFWVHLGWVSFLLGIDGVSLLFAILTCFLIALCLLTSWGRVFEGKKFILAFLSLEWLCLVSFSTSDILLFYVIFESIAIPMFIIIGLWGARIRKVHAAYKFFLYTIGGSIFMFLGFLICFLNWGSTDILLWLKQEISPRRQILLFLCFFLSFAIKVPMVPFHIWLTEAHVEAPAAGSVILAGILLKLGGYGILRFLLPVLPYGAVYFSPFVLLFSIISLFFASITALRQIDLKKIIAYSSVAHMNLVNIGFFSFNLQGFEGGLFLMLSHGLVSSALFFCIGVIYDRFRTRILKYFGGLGQFLPLFAFLFFFFSLANMGLPGTSSFIGEFLVLVGIFQSNTFCMVLASFGGILCAAFSLWLANRLFFGNLSLIKNKFIFLKIFDIDKRDSLTIFPLLLFTLLFGIRGDLILDIIHVSLSYVLGFYSN
jgi:proton-translocating NADH-quinone oxidoreductase chain M